jgi:hypothetical protein
MTTTTMVNFVIITTVMIMTIVFCHGRRRSVISSTVFLGPGFRVVSCDCRGHFADPEDYCGFCLCRCTTCGGSPVGRALSSYASRAAYGSGAGGRGAGKGGVDGHGGGARGACGGGVGHRLGGALSVPVLSCGRRRGLVPAGCPSGRGG